MSRRLTPINADRPYTFIRVHRRSSAASCFFLASLTVAALAAQPAQPPAAGAPSRADILRGGYGPYRANNDLLFYHLDVRVDPEKKFLSGKVAIRFKMLQDATRIQLDLHAALHVDQILLGGATLKYERDSGAVFVDFPETLRAGRTYSIDFHYSGNPVETGRFGAITFKKDSSGHPWINTACEGIGASVWWPNKDQWRDEVESMEISVSIPNDLVDVSNGKFMGKTDLGDGYTRWDWLVQYPINNYDVSLNIGNYQHWADRLGDLPLDLVHGEDRPGRRLYAMGLAGAIPHQQLRRLAQHRQLPALGRPPGRSAARFLRPAGRPAKSQEAVRPGQGNAGSLDRKS